ncbi:hypothetical protein SMD44_07932 [Streptomyces alboflavus]|uniref:Uncharacterized protein n=1 Tax=Streptomyces alboflavus TaxID=67267 RepID=A0A1Z1WPU2_9ACTN|nr:hypothetical protein SMD44_07932 [Streptomyces alboflavus]
MTVATTAATTPTSSETRSPYTHRRSRSRPTSSVPKGWSRDGGRSLSARCTACSSRSTRGGTISTARTTAATIAAELQTRHARVERDALRVPAAARPVASAR